MSTATAPPWELIAEAFGDGYIPRPEQQEMADAVEAAIAGRHHLVVEAGTGVGKSFAYLVPAIMAVKTRELRVVVSTRTIALQEQLAEKDVPFLLKALDAEGKVDVVLVKGRSNFVCRRRVALARAGGPKLVDVDGLDQQLEDIFRWSETSVDGSLSDLHFRPDPRVWSQVMAERGNCLGKKCKFYDACGWQRARRGLIDAKLVIANHSLVFADMALKATQDYSILGEYDVLVLDEAHEAAAVATEAFKAQLTERRVNTILGKIHPKRDADKKQTILGRAGAPAEVALLVSEAREAATLYFDGAAKFRPAFIKDRRIRKPRAFPDPLSPKLERLLEIMDENRPPRGQTDLRLEWSARMKNIEELLEDLAAFQVLKAAEHVVYWQEWDRKEKPVLAAAPLHIAPLMRKHVFDEIPTVICASATLQVGGGFSHFTREVGADGAKELDVGSPFDFERQCELRIYPGAPDPREPQFLDPFSTCVMGDLVEESKGGAFLLFTSHKALKKAHALLSGYFDRLGLKTFVQGNYPPKHIVEQFRRHDNCVLFGTDTFWQGVDVRGENLRLVVLHKLPFAVPTHPLRLAREDAIKKRGGNPFVTLSVPEAVIKVKQGFGRLIRSSDDTGVVAILDPRLKTKGYGKTFLKSLPPCSVKEIS